MAVLGVFRPGFFLFGESTLSPAHTDLRLGGYRDNMAPVEERKLRCTYIYSVTSVKNWGITNSFSYF